MHTAEKTRHFTSYINGQWTQAEATKTLENINPATGESLGTVFLVGREEAKQAIEAAHKAFESWRDTPAPRRGQLLFKAMHLLEQRLEEVATALHLEEGKLLAEARGEVQKSLNILEFTAGEGRRLGGQTVPSEMSNTFCYTIKQPLGVVGLITPWNFPVAIPIWKMAPALIAGNTIVLKPASNTPWTAALIAEIFHEAGFPPGVVNMVLGPGSSVGDEIVNNPKVRALSFTGSNQVGQDLYKQGAARGVKVQCEMGGKNPIVILEDADLDLAVEATVQGAFGSTGQRCTATSRAIVIDSVADEFVRKLVARTKDYHPGRDLGPVVDTAQLKEVLEAIEQAKKDGAKCLSGGKRSDEGELTRGYYVEPTLFDHVDPKSHLALEEVFGPVLAILRVKDLDEALEVANSVRYGLSSSIYSKDSNRIFKFLDRIETGITHVNSPTMGGEAQLPFGGVKDTGVGAREQGAVAIDFFTELKTVYIDYTGQKRDSKIY
ncbi:MAG: aldehyde dehydrogenase family protein [Candidatus Eremiobacteraeota bacterium]|nr:aldehyde dehydrogenase family protein [Candidatus Eremiobacteraeota bacterium]